ncbi:hypothetical protein Sgleb_61160 [Streptomyces glebosus]|uniref:Uncharacterized protein n=1 Tax=Streptomyces glebosus TaxID=249580 RepID=A0A640T2X7_9ACTN|nr:hypothetical protein [Streptomyces glebosus]GFE18069.1 hypothetical protein Sgleb_61160 [Streptomyces glebosus]GHG46208.1 hypothetical protein GCM10010513_01840 [Streptomyces glebosus]
MASSSQVWTVEQTPASIRQKICNLDLGVLEGLRSDHGLLTPPRRLSTGLAPAVRTKLTHRLTAELMPSHGELVCHGERAASRSVSRSPIALLPDAGLHGHKYAIPAMLGAITLT